MARILVAEDNYANRFVTARQLQKLGYAADVATNGREVLDAVATGAYDLVLMDCQMPEVDGFQATRAIRDKEDGAKHLPIIALTAHAMSGDKQRCLRVGMDDYLAKPIRMNDLARAIGRWIGPGRV